MYQVVNPSTQGSEVNADITDLTCPPDQKSPGRDQKEVLRSHRFTAFIRTILWKKNGSRDVANAQHLCSSSVVVAVGTIILRKFYVPVVTRKYSLRGGWPSGPRRQTQVLVSVWRRGFEPHFAQENFFLFFRSREFFSVRVLVCVFSRMSEEILYGSRIILSLKNIRFSSSVDRDLKKTFELAI